MHDSSPFSSLSFEYIQCRSFFSKISITSEVAPPIGTRFCPKRLFTLNMTSFEMKATYQRQETAKPRKIVSPNIAPPTLNTKQNRTHIAGIVKHHTN
ncbi:hypothetical protein CDAR_438981 [Caerostris darwini]|uniref:Uncharacterized protein n=1 Tax=Caerostris darwini TaxID=1538125 RepID=A0AAV4MI38_9ARAC|nr:hypothetical protein CDAR_438981 [Caerostris darwini]